ncbi:MAG: glycosyltransferase, partial [Trebonia sp.]
AQHAARAAWRGRFGRYVLAVGGIEPRKGSLDLLEAYALLRSSASDVRLVIAGGETLFDYRDYRAAWDARAAALFGGTPDTAAPGTLSALSAPFAAPAVLGPVAHDALPSLMAGASAFCFPSVREGFGLAALEALAAGVPVVTRSLPVLREVFGPAARFADHPAGFAGELRAALESPGELRAAGRALAARYTWQAAAAAHIAVYQRR